MPNINDIYNKRRISTGIKNRRDLEELSFIDFLKLTKEFASAKGQKTTSNVAWELNKVFNNLAYEKWEQWFDRHPEAAMDFRRTLAISGEVYGLNDDGFPMSRVRKFDSEPGLSPHIYAEIFTVKTNLRIRGWYNPSMDYPNLWIDRAIVNTVSEDAHFDRTTHPLNVYDGTHSLKEIMGCHIETSLRDVKEVFVMGVTHIVDEANASPTANLVTKLEEIPYIR